MLTGEDGDSTMDKKSRPPAQAPKSNASDSRIKKQDGSNGGRYQRFNKRREPQQSFQRYDSPPSRKPTPQKSKMLDKRPRQRAYTHDNQQNFEVADEVGAEVGSALHSGSKKANLNHLLGFTFTPRDVVGFNTHGPSGGTGRNWKGRNKWGCRKVRYNKEHYLQANCQFIVREDADYTMHFADPDVLVDWDLIEQVNIFSHEMPCCPICLYSPTAAKITRCGHIYCWACMLHYLSLGEKSWRKCPICYESVHQKDLKSVKCIPSRQYVVNDQITMRLMKRERGSTYTMNASQWTERNGQPHSCNDNVDTRFLKLLTMKNEDTLEIVTAEISALQLQLSEEVKGSIEASYVEAAIALAREREKSILLKLGIQDEVAVLMNDMQINSCEEQQVAASPVPPLKDVKSYASAFSDEEDLADEDNVIAADQSVSSDQSDGCSLEQSEDADRKRINSGSEESDVAAPTNDIEEEVEEINIDEAAKELEMPAEGATSKPGPNVNVRTDIYYFYQAADGQNVFLNSLNARCLVTEYGSLQNAPDTITAQIVGIEDFSMTQELRHRLKYLNHLPLTCEFQVAELALKTPILSRETLRYYGEEIERRRRARQRKQREERKHNKKSEDQTKKMLGLYPSMRTNIESRRHFPGHHGSAESVHSANSASGQSSSGSTPLTTPIGSPIGLNPDATEFVPFKTGSGAEQVNVSPETSATAHLSFAQMLQSGKTKVNMRPPVARTQSTAVPSKVKGADSDDSESEDRVPVPVYQESFGSAIQKALDDLATTPGKDVLVEESSPSVGKKKKKVKKLLFTTTMARSK